MALQRMKWSNTGANLIGPRDGALLRSPVVDGPYRTQDAAPPRRSARPRDQQDPEPGTLLCRIGQSGETGDWAAVDGEGRPLTVTKAGDGTLEIRHGPGDQEDPDTIQLQAPFGDANAGAPGENIPGQAFEQRLSAAIAPSDRTSDRNPAGLRGLQRLMDSHYRRR